MNRSVIFRIIMAVVLIGAILALGAFAYNTGMARGIAIGAQAGSGAVPLAPIPALYPPYMYGMPFFGLMSCLVPLFLLFLVLVAFRALFGPHRHGWHRMQHGAWDKEEWPRHIPPMFEEWHHRAHETKPAESAEPTQQ